MGCDFLRVTKRESASRRVRRRKTKQRRVDNRVARRSASILIGRERDSRLPPVPDTPLAAGNIKIVDAWRENSAACQRDLWKFRREKPVLRSRSDRLIRARLFY